LGASKIRSSDLHTLPRKIEPQHAATSAQRLSVPLFTIAHVWWDYLPKTFIEPHPYLVNEGKYNSIIVAAIVYDNGNSVDSYTYYRNKKALSNLHSPTLGIRIMNRIFRPLNRRSSNRFISRNIRQQQASLLHIHFGTTAAEMLNIIKENRIPTVVSFYGVDASAAFKNPGYLRRYRELFQLADRFIVLCEPVRKPLLSKRMPV